MEKFNFVKSLTKVNNITSLPFRKGLGLGRLILCLSLAVFGVEDMWGKTWYATAYVEAVPQKGGYVKVISKGATYIDENVKEGEISSATSSKTHSQWNLSSSSGDVDFSAYAKSKSGYTFKGWATSSSAASGDMGSTDHYYRYTFSVTSKSTSSPGQSVYRYAIFTPNTYTITFDRQNGTGGSNSVTATYDAAMPSASAPTRVGYTFQGYFDATSGGNKYYNADMSSAQAWNKTGNTTLYAHWTAISYNVQYNANGGSGSMSNQSFKFDEQKSLTANSLTNSYTISFDGNGGSTPSEISSSRTFEGWEDRSSIVYNGVEYKYTDFDAPYYANTYGDLYAAFGYNKYNLLNHYVNNGSGEGRSCKGDTPGLYPNQASVANLSTTNGATIPLYAHWSVNGAAITLPSASKNNSVLVGWYNGDNFVGEPGDSYTPSGDVTLIAHWASKYDITVTGSDQSIKVGGTQDNAFTFVHAENPTPKIAIVSIDPINNGDGQVIEYDAANNKIIAHNAGTATICFKQAGTSTMNEGTSATFTYTISKIANTLTANATHSMKVEEQWESVISGKNSDANVTTTSSDETVAYYDVANDKIVAQNTGNQSFNSKEVTITIKQAETYKYTAAEKTIKVTVNKWDNNISINGSQDSYATSCFMDSYAQITSLTASNTDYAGSPISNNQTSGNDIAVMNNEQTQVTSNYNLGTATWTISQPENYKYKAANATLTVSVVKQAEATDCYVLNDESEHKFSTGGLDFSGHFDTPFAINGPAYQLTFDAKKDKAGANQFVAQYSIDGGNNWIDVNMPDLSDSYQQTPFGPFNIPDNTTHIRFGAKTGGTLSKYYKNVRVTRKTYLNAADVDITETASQNPIHPNETGVGTLTINHSLANGGDLKVKWDNNKFTINGKTAAQGIDLGDLGCSTGVSNLPISYTSAEAGTHKANVVIYNNVYRATATITGTTIKRNQSIQWNTDIMIVGQTKENAAQTNSIIDRIVTYTSDNTEVIRVNNDANGQPTILEALQPGTANITAFSAGNEEYNDASDTKEITVTDKDIQYIVWNQSLMRLILGDDNVTLTASASQPDSLNCSTGGQRSIIYQSMNESVVKIVNNNQLQIVGAGVTTVTATQEGGLDIDGHDFIEVTAEKKVVVLDPNAPCETYIYEQTSEVEFDLGWNAVNPQTRTKEIDFGGQEPRYVNFDYKGKSHDVLFEYYEGTLRIDQYINGEWIEVVNLGQPTKNGNYVNTGNIELNRYATKMRVRAESGRGYMYFKDCIVTLARYLEGSTLNTFETKVGSPIKQTLTVSYSNISGPLTFSLSGNSNFTINSSSLDGVCGDKGSTTIEITYSPTAAVNNEEATLTLADGDRITYITLHGKASVTPLHIVWDIQDVQPCYTINEFALSAQALTDLNAEIANFVWFSFTQNSTTGTINQGNILTFDKAGTAIVAANTTTGDSRFSPAPTIYKTWNVSLTPTEIVTAPEIDGEVVYGATLGDIKLKANTGTAQNTINHQAVDGTFAITSGDISTAGQHTVTVTFTPTNTDMYAGCTKDINITIQKAQPNATAQAGEIIYGATVESSILTNTGTTEGTWTWKENEKEKVLPAGTHEGLKVHFTPTDPNYNEIDGTVSLTVNKATPTLSWTSEHATADVKDQLTYTATSNHSESVIITYSITAGDDCASIDANTGVLTITKAGTITVQALQAASDNYEEATITTTTTLTGKFENIFNGNGDWNTPENWSLGLVPTEENPDVVVSGEMTISEPISVGGLTIEQNGKVNIEGNGDLTVNGTSAEREGYGNLFVRNGGNITINESAEVKVYDFVVESSIGTSDGSSQSGQVANGDKVLYTNGAYIDINMDPDGTMDDTQWYGFTVPFPVDVRDGVARKEGDIFRNCTYGVDYMIAEYDMTQRLNTGKGWKYIQSGQLQPGHFYYFTVNGNYNTYSFKAADNTITIYNETSIVTNGEGANANWNAVGNTTLTYASVSGENLPLYVQTYINGESRYQVVSTADAQFVVGCPFFIQASENTTMVLNTPSSTVEAHYAPRRGENSRPMCVRIAETGRSFSDQMYLTAAEDALDEYETGRDLAKAGVGTQSAQLWINAYGQQLCAHHATLTGDNAIYDMALYAPKNGEYELSMPYEPVDGTLYLTQDGMIIWNLNQSPYPLTLPKGTTYEYGLLFCRTKQNAPTNTESLSTDSPVNKVIYQQHLYILHQGRVYDAAGTIIKKKD